jgi:hypothetical protein
MKTGKEVGVDEDRTDSDDEIHNLHLEALLDLIQSTQSSRRDRIEAQEQSAVEAQTNEDYEFHSSVQYSRVFNGTNSKSRRVSNKDQFVHQSINSFIFKAFGTLNQTIPLEVVSPDKLTSAAKKIESFTFQSAKQYEMGIQTLTDFTAKLLKHYVVHSEDIETRTFLC